MASETLTESELRSQVEVQIQERIVEVPHIQTIEKVVEAKQTSKMKGYEHWLSQLTDKSHSNLQID